MLLVIQERIFILHILISCLHCFGQGQDVVGGLLGNLKGANQKNLRKLSSIPQVATLLYNPAFSRYSGSIMSGASKLKAANGSFVLNNILNENYGKCSQDLNLMSENYSSTWALRMFDSSGKIKSGILVGELIWTGSYTQCVATHAPLEEDGEGDFHGKYCVSTWNQYLFEEHANETLTIGLCVPDSCSGDDIKAAILNTSHVLDGDLGIQQVKSYIKFKSVVCKVEDKSLDAPAYIYLCVTSIFIIMAVVGTLLDVLGDCKLKHHGKTNLLNSIPSQAYGTLVDQKEVENPLRATFENKLPGNEESVTSDLGESKTDRSVNTVKRFLLCFSIISNGQSLMNIKKIDGQLLTIHGIKFLSLAWVIFGHTFVHFLPVVGNKLEVLEDMDRVFFQFVFQATYAVDTFFLISGFLLTYLFLKYATLKDGKIDWVVFYVHRIWRLTPAYLFLVFFYMLIFKHIGHGPFWPNDLCDADRHSWWKYILYIQNFIPTRDVCVGWAWYLANDMQFYVISPLFLYPLWRWPTIGFTFIASILIGTWIITAIISYSYDLIPLFIGIVQAKDLNAYHNRMLDTFDLIYDKPYARIAPYIIGAILGYIFFKTDDKKDFLTWWQQLLGWTISTFCSLIALFGLYHVEVTTTLGVLYNSFSRTLFSIGVAWVIYACETGHGGFITKILSWKVFVPLSRITYSAYLVHPLITRGYAFSSPTIKEYTRLEAAMTYTSILCVSYVLAFVFSLLFESPFLNLEKMLLRRKKH